VIRQAYLPAPMFLSEFAHNSYVTTIVLAWAVLLAWGWLLLGRGRFWVSGPILGGGVPKRQYRIAVVVPARDEAEHVIETLESLLAQELHGDLCVVLVDDNSTDGTGELARSLQAQDARLRVVTGRSLPVGWTGKIWAVAQGLEQPEVKAADYVLLTDADIVHGAGHLAAHVAKAEAEGLDLVSEMVRLRTEAFAERALIPAFVFFFQMLYPFRCVGDRSHSIAAAAGGTMLLSRAGLDRVNGVENIRGALIDDVALAQQIKRSGHGIWLGHGEAVVSMRRYPALADVWQMIARTAYVQLNYSPLLLLGTVAGMMLLYGLPVLLAIAAQGGLRWVGLASWGLMAAMFQPTLQRYRQSWVWGLALPGIASFYAAATVASAWRFYRGTGGSWKSRVYPTGV
jgi:hopene-associated glycosyltransferase HpnB